ncbi:hypothetical protein ACEPAI_318 [Sanghuangporus weigelae]
MARFRAFFEESDEEGSSSSSSPRSPRQSKSKSANGKPLHQPSYAAPGSTDSSTEDSGDDESYAAGEDVGSTDVSEEDESTQGEEVGEEEATAWAKQLNLEPHKVNVMQTSLFRIPDIEKVTTKDNFTFLRRRLPSDIISEKKASRTRTSFAQPRSQPPPRKYVRVSLDESVSATHANVYIDAGLSMGRSFRVGWGPGNKLVHVGTVISPESSPSTSNSSIVNITSLKVDSPATPDLLQHLLSNSELVSPSDENDHTPSAGPKPDVTFSSFSALFLARDRSHGASVFRLCHALFDPINLHLKDDVPSDIRSRVVALRRADALSSWLSRTVAASIERDIKGVSSSDSAQLAFLYLTGYQVERAAEVLMDKGNVRLATIVSQIPSDAEFRTDISEQLEIWKEEKVDMFMSEPIRKLYALAAGEVVALDGSTRDRNIDMVKGLDWLRVLGLLLWYSASFDASLDETFKVYEEFIEANYDKVGYPTPWYSKSTPMHRCSKDGLFNLMKLSLSPSMTLESALEPFGFSSNPRDYRMPWFLYILLSRCLRIRDFIDRQVSVTMDLDTGSTQEVEGYSQVANILTTNFAGQLEQERLIQESAYVLLFLEDEVMRKSAIKELLSRSAPLLDEYTTAGLCGSLRIPMEWVDEAKATYAFYSGDVYLAYELYTDAKTYQSAHELAITYLAPEAVLRDELDVLTRLFTALDSNRVSGFDVGGQLFIDYARIVSRIPELREIQLVEVTELTEAEKSELDALNTRIPRLIEILPDVLHDKPGTGDQCRAALSHMLSRLLDCVDPSVEVDMHAELVEEGALINHIHASAYGSFMTTIENMA